MPNALSKNVPSLFTSPYVRRWVWVRTCPPMVHTRCAPSARPRRCDVDSWSEEQRNRWSTSKQNSIAQENRCRLL